MSIKKNFPLYIILAIYAVLMVIEFWIYTVDFFRYAPYVELGDTTEYDALYYTEFANWTYLLSIIFPAITIACFILWLVLFKVKTLAGKVGLLLAIGVGLWYAGDLYYAILWFSSGIDSPPENNLARYLYIVGYIIFVIALVLQIRSGETKLASTEKIIMGAILGVMIFLMLWFVVIPLYIYIGTTEYAVEEFTRFFLICFSIGDMIVISLILALIFKYRGGMYARSWFVLVSGFLIFAVFDLLNAYLGYFSVSPVYDYYPYFTDHLYALAYIMLGIGAMHFFNSIRTTSV